VAVKRDRGSSQQLGILGVLGHGRKTSRTTMRRFSAAEESDNWAPWVTMRRSPPLGSTTMRAHSVIPQLTTGECARCV
jgi:hypothetical protein